VNEIVSTLRQSGRPQTRRELGAQIRGLHPSCATDSANNSNTTNDDGAFNASLARAVESGAVVRVALGDGSARQFICWRLGAIFIDANVLVGQLDDATARGAAFPSAASKKRPLASSPRNVSNASKVGKSSSSSSAFKSPFKPVATPKRANVVAATPLVAADPLAQAVERFLAAKARLRALKDRDPGAKVATRTTPSRPAENDARLEQLIASWRDACTSAFEQLLPRQRHNDTGKPFTRAQLGRALQIEPAHVGLEDWSDDEQEQEENEAEEEKETIEE
jgi:hypothetical protein